jgi:hypothetical protein
MKTRTKVAAIAIGGIVGVGALVAVPALAAAPPDGDGPNPGPGPGSGQMMEQRGAGPGRMMGDRVGCDSGWSITEPSGTLTEAQRATLAYNAEEEKAAHDLYTEFAARYDAMIFDRIAAAEASHLAAVRTLMSRYEVADPTVDRAQGSFADPGIQATYNDLLARGSASEQAALEASRTVETNDIAQLRSSLEGVTAPDVQRVYTHLLHASERHLAAFEYWLAK